MSADLLEVYLVACYTETVGANYSCRQACLYWYALCSTKTMRKSALTHLAMVPRKLGRQITFARSLVINETAVSYHRASYCAGIRNRQLSGRLLNLTGDI